MPEDEQILDMVQQLADLIQKVQDQTDYLGFAIPFAAGAVVGAISAYALWRNALKW